MWMMKIAFRILKLLSTIRIFHKTLCPNFAQLPFLDASESTDLTSKFVSNLCIPANQNSFLLILIVLHVCMCIQNPGMWRSAKHPNALP